MPITTYCFIVVNCVVFGIESAKIYNENTVADGNILCKRIHPNL